LAKDPADRFQNGDDLVNALDELPIIDAKTGLSSPKRTASRRTVSQKTSPGSHQMQSDAAASGQKKVISILLASLGALLIVLIWAMSRGSTPSIEIPQQPSSVPIETVPKDDDLTRQNRIHDAYLAAAQAALAREDLSGAARNIDMAKAIRSSNEVLLLETQLKVAVEKRRRVEAGSADRPNLRPKPDETPLQPQAPPSQTVKSDPPPLDQESNEMAVLREKLRLAEEQNQAAEREAELNRRTTDKKDERQVKQKPTLLSDPFNIEMVVVSGGRFQMGSNSAESFPDERPVHLVTVGDFKLSKTEVTQEQWQAVMGNNPAFFKKSGKHPVENVSWNDVRTFIRKLNQVSGKKYRLPTEAEWEYAARGGDKADRYGNIDAVAWYDRNSKQSTQQVAKKKANAYGLYDMLGNVWEWVGDLKDDYGTAARNNPTGPVDGAERAFRGGAWDCLSRGCRVSTRDWADPSVRRNVLGFRLAADLR
jgi:formylglycine-generating enzyme required for sulfatase activity